MAIRVNSIVKPGQEMKECRDIILAERRYRASLRLRASESYRLAHLAQLDSRIAALEAEKAAFLQRVSVVQSDVEASLARTHAARIRLQSLKHRAKLDRHAEIARQAREIQATYGFSEEQMAAIRELKSK